MKVTKKQIAPGIVILEMAGRFVMGPDCRQVDQEVDAHIERNEKIGRASCRERVCHNV